MDAKTNPAHYYPSDGYFEAVVDTSKEDWTWECKINLEENKIPDGSYDVIITVEDGAGKTGKSERSFTIDNTPPLLVLSRPAGGWAEGIDKSNVQNYGATFTLKGEAADDNGISLIELFFYNEAGELLTEEPVSIKNALSTINEDVFSYEDGSGIYERLYGTYDEKNPETKYFSMLVKIYDEARIFPAAEGDKGNYREYFFLNDDVSASILRSEVKISGAYQMENGRYLLTKGNTEENIDTQNRTMDILAKKQVVRTAFSLNPSNNPQMSISSLTNLSSVKTMAEKYELIKNSSAKNVLKSNDSLPVAMAVGLDEIPLVKDSLGVYLEKCVYENNEIKGDNNKIWLVKPTDEYAIDGKPLTENEKNARLLIKNQGNYTMNIPLSSSGISGTIPETGEAYTIPSIATGQMYMICAVGEDQNGVKFKNNVNWALFFAPSGNAPTLYDLTPEKAKTIYLNDKKESVPFNGKIRTEQKTTVSLLLNGSQVKDQEFSIENAYDGAFSKALSLKPGDFKDEGAYTVSIHASIDPTLFTQSDYTVIYDTTAPQAKFEYSPTVKDWQITTESGKIDTIKVYTINGNVSVKVTSLEDSNGVYSEKDGAYPSPTIEIFECDENGKVKEDAVAIASYTSDDNDEVERRRPQNEFDTTTFKRPNGTKIDKTYLLIRVTSYDNAGNKGCESKVVYLDQESDRPVIEPKNVTEKNEETYPSEIKNVYNTEGQITFAVSDDDGVDSVEISLYEVDESGKVSESHYEGTGDNKFEGKRTYSVGGLTRDTIEYSLPSAYGTYKLVIIAKDTAKKEGQDTVKNQFYLKTTPSAPILSISNNGNYYARPGAQLIVEGRVTGVNGLEVFNSFVPNDESKNIHASGNSEGKNKGSPKSEQNPDGIDAAAGSATWNDTLSIASDAKESQTALTHTYIARDKNGKTGNATLEYWIDSTPPVVKIDALTVADSKITVPKYSFTGSSEEGKSDSPQSGVAKVFYRIVSDKTKMVDNDTKPVFDTGWQQCATATVWKIDCNFVDVNSSVPDSSPLTFSEGKYTLYAYSEDAAGNRSVKDSELPFTVVLGNPVVDLKTISGGTTIKDGASSKNPFKFNYRAVDPASSGSNQGTNITLKEEYVEVTITRAASLESNASVETLQKNVDYTISSEIDGDGYATITMTGKNGADALNDGKYTLTVNAKDPADKNECTKESISIVYDTTGPTIKTPVLFWGTGDTSQVAINGYYNTRIVKITNIESLASDDLSGLSEVSYSFIQKETNYENESELKQNPPSWNPIALNSKTQTISLEDTSSAYLWIKAVDALGNEKYWHDPTCYKVDTTLPQIAVVSPSTNPATVGSVFEIKAEISDIGSGFLDADGNILGKVEAKFEGLENPVVLSVCSDEDDVVSNDSSLWKGEVDLSKVAADSVGYTVTAIDSAGNASVSSRRVVKFDRVPPKINSVSLSNGSVVYGKELTVSGTASDDEGLQKVEVFRKKSENESGTTTSFTYTDKSGTKTYSDVIPLDIEDNGSNGVSWSLKKPIDTTALDKEDGTEVGTGELTLYVLATDTSGNQMLETRAVNIDQDAARPIVKIGGIDLTASMNSENPIWVTSNILYSCSINAATNMEIEAAKYGYAANAISKSISSPSSFSIEDMPEGTQSLYFYVKYKSGEEYTSSASYSLSAPKLTDNNKHLYGYKDEGISQSFVSMTVDLTPPQIKKVFYANESKESSIPTINETNEAKWSVWSDTEIPAFGGTKRPSVDIVLYVHDANGIGSVSASTRNNETISFEKVDGMSTADGTCYKGTYTPANISGSTRITFTVKDKANNVLSAAYTLYFDNQGPSVIINTSSEQQVSGANITLAGRTENIIGSNDSTSALYYAIKPLKPETLEWGIDRLSGTPPESPSVDDADWEEYKVSSEIASLGSWTIIFNGETLNGSTHTSAKVLNDYIIKCYGEAYSEAQKTGKFPTMKSTLSEAISDADPNTQYSIITPLYVFFKAVDSVGNITVTQNTFFYNVDPQGNRPVVTISNPTNKITTGGVIRMYGSASELKDGIEAVYVQIDPKLKVSDENNPDLTQFNKDSWFNHFPAENTCVTEDVVDSGSAIIGKGIKTNLDGGLWSLNINNDLSLEEWIGIRVYAVGKNGKISFPAEVVIKVAKDIPIIGGSERLYLVQREGNKYDGKITASRLYESGMWVNGAWFLTGSVEHSNGISELTIESGTSNTSLVSNSIIQANGAVEAKSWNTGSASDTSSVAYGTKGYALNYRLGTETGFGALNFKVYAKANVSDDVKETSMPIVINYDNTPPTLNIDTTAGFMVNKGEVQNSNGIYTMGGVVTENSNGSFTQSGFHRVAFYFTRETEKSGTVSTQIYDPMVATKSGAGIPLDNTIVEKEGLLCKKLTVTRLKTNLDTLTLPLSDDFAKNHIRAGGIVMVDGTFYLISSKSGNSVKISDQVRYSSENDTMAEEVYFALAQIVDNLTAETLSNDKETVLYDDGDGMCEKVITTGTTTNFQASFNSHNIPDGEIKIHIVAFDVAGNHTPISTDRMVSNNAPRLAGVRIASDLNGDGRADSNEYIGRWNALMERYMYDSNYADYSSKISGNDVNAIEKYGEFVKLLGYDSAARRNSAIILSKDTTENGDPELTIRGDTWIYPTIVGGNSSLKYEYKVYKNTSDSDPESTSSLISIATNVQSDSVNYSEAMTFTLKDDFLEAGGRKISDGMNKKAVFTIWDATEGTTQGTDSQYATITLIFNLALDDKTAPVVNINPLYWKSATDNSLYQSSKEYGHIELPSDLEGLPNVKITAADTLDKKTPKVSGKIVIEGSANDNNRIDELYFAFDSLPATTDGTSTKKILAARYDPTNAQSKNDFVIASGHDIAIANDAASPQFADGWMFEVTSSEFDMDKGHTVGFKLYIDTQKINTVAAIGRNCYVYAVDRGIPTLSGSTVGYANGNFSLEKGYKLDIVPYITSIETDLRDRGGLKSNNIRGASGKFSVMKGNDSTTATNFITVKGFNLNPNSVRIVKSGDKNSATPTTGTAIGYSNGSKDITEDGKMEFNCTNDFGKSGYLEVWTNGVRAINNINNNDAVDLYSKRDSYANYTQRATDYQNMYNREPDLYTTSNVQLTDDRYILLFDMKQTDVKNGYYPTMIMDGDDPVFGYLDKSGGEADGLETSNKTTTATKASIGANNAAGSFHAGDAMPQRAKFNGSTADLMDKEFLIKASAWDQMSMAKDDAGRYYHLALYDRDGGGLNFVYDRYAELYNKSITVGDTTYKNPACGWGAGYVYSGYRAKYEIPEKDDEGNIINVNPANNVALDLENNALAFEAITYGGTPAVFGRYQYPKIIAKGNSVSANSHATVYMCYYDSYTAELYFRNFQLGTTVSGTAYSLATSGKAADGKTYAQKVNIKEAEPNSIYAAFPADNSIKGRIDVCAKGAGSKHFSMGVTSDNRVVFAFYNPSTGKLRVRYSDNSINGSSPTTKPTFTNNDSAEGKLPSYVGQYVSMAIDSKNHIHIAAFNADDADLVYIYLNSYSDPNPVIVKVDQAGSVGFWTQIKVLETDGKIIPYIAYYNTSEINSREGVKLAYFNGSILSSSDVKPGVDEKTGYTTGDWEYMTVPAITPPQGGIEEFENVCLDFDSNKKPVLGYSADYIEFGKWCDE